MIASLIPNSARRIGTIGVQGTTWYQINYDAPGNGRIIAVFKRKL